MSEPRRLSAEAWKAMVREQAQSGQTVVAFCRKRRLAPSTFHYYRRRLREETDGKGFRQLRIHGGSGVRLVLECGRWQIDLDRGFDGTVLREAVEALR